MLQSIKLDLPPLPYGMATGLGFILGLVIGSYLATILWRWPRGQSANVGGSRCDGCDRILVWYELIPLVGPALAWGQYRSCGIKIGWRHSMMELTCGVLGGYCFALDMAWLTPLAWLLVLLAWFDARHLWLPNQLVVSLAVVAFLAPAAEPLTMMLRLFGGVVGFGALWLVATAYRQARGRVGLGGGDAKLFGAIGLSVGALDLPLVLLIASAIGLVDAGLRLKRGANARVLRLPLGTYLCVATIGLIVYSPFRQ